ncbi:glycosyltransferase [Bacillus sp. DNRA2]|uniref:glycosyltransferase family 2 protein n=1 Tax=Bacillus sp. DNRA2 TaxID=2723053 RepID=UPI00145D0327|nr:glycosyltransferase [Bacillus sp. DNRA2]NMD70862.1 glycosyltransferase [Bacillus sp. DNRA2]
MNITVIVAAYNVENYIEKCLQSIISQTFENLQIIVVNDGSTDGTLTKINNIATSDRRFLVINKENGGLSSARNAGLDMASGDYIGFIDGDDYISPGMYENLIKQIVDYDCDISMCAVQKVYNSYVENDCLNESSAILSRQEALQALVDEEFVKHYAWNKLYKASLFEKIRYPVGKLYEDIFTTYKLFSLVDKVAYSNQIGYYYLQRQGSILRSKFDEKKLDCIAAFAEFKDYVDHDFPSLSSKLNWRVNLSVINSLFDMLKSEAIYPDCQYTSLGRKLVSHVRKNLLFYVIGRDIAREYKVLALLSLGGYRFMKLLFHTSAIKRIILKKTAELA